MAEGPERAGAGPDEAVLAAVTMVYNEVEHLPYWTAHYAAELGASHCTVIDHGSDPALIAAWRAGIGRDVNLLRLPRSPQDDDRRAAFVSTLCAGLLGYYDAVIYTDCDELVVADPSRHASLVDYVRHTNGGPGSLPGMSRPHPAVAYAAGYELIHRSTQEAPFDWTRRASLQRRWLRPSSALCKPVLIRRPVRWAPGFHCADAPLAFDDLSLFHLRFVDETSGLDRLERTRAQPWADPQAGSHQRMAGQDWIDMLRAMAGLPRDTDRTLDATDAELVAWLGAIAAAERIDADPYRFPLDMSVNALWALPERFVGRF